MTIHRYFVNKKWLFLIGDRMAAWTDRTVSGTLAGMSGFQTLGFFSQSGKGER
ncbi:hypothetical protein [Pseudochelatococcus lubricantis]|uniref:hypothetical protein n=1 Tax=Pseudochelatococcus lubricantis TaxID=1538102 RepID=UPI0036701B42